MPLAAELEKRNKINLCSEVHRRDYELLGDEFEHHRRANKTKACRENPITGRNNLSLKLSW